MTVDAARIEVRSAAATDAGDWFGCGVVWAHPTLDVVLLKVTSDDLQVWEPPVGSSVLAAMGETALAAEALGFPEVESRPDGLRGVEQAPGVLLPGGGVRREAVPFDVGVSVPDDALLWQGMSGGAVCDGEGRLVGVVARVRPDRQQRRLLVVPVEDACADEGFAAAAVGVGLDPTVEDRHARFWRRNVVSRSLTPAGVPATVATVSDDAVFGVHGPVLGPGHGYVGRDKDGEVAAALTEARSGGRRVVLLVGDSAAGKSRTAAEAVRSDPVFQQWRLVAPLTESALLRDPDAVGVWRETVLWLDDLDKHLARGLDEDALRRVLAADPAVVVVATIRAAQLDARRGDLADPAWRFLTAEGPGSAVHRVRLDAAFSDDERVRAAEEFDDPRLLAALEEGVGLGEWLVAGPELMKKLRTSRGPDGVYGVFADVVIAWYRTGLSRPLDEQAARRLWLNELPDKVQQRLTKRGDDAIDQLLAKASAWACEMVAGRDLYEQAITTMTTDGYEAHDYVVDQIMRREDRLPVPDSVWDHAIHTATMAETSDEQIFGLAQIGSAANTEQAYPIELRVWELLGDSGVDNKLAALSLLHMARAFGRLERYVEEINVYGEVVDRFGEAPEPGLRELIAIALVDKAITLREGLGRDEEAVGVYGEVVDRFGDAPEPELQVQVAKALLNKANTVGELGRPEEAVEMYGEVVERIGDAPEPELQERAAMALFNKANTVGELGRPEEAVEVYGEVVERLDHAAEPELQVQVAKALFNKALTLGRMERPEEEVKAYDEVVARFGDAPEPELRDLVAKSLFDKALTLGRMERPEEEVEVYGEVVDRFGDAPEPELRKQVAKALFNKAVTLGRMERPQDEIDMYGEVVDRFGDAPQPELRDMAATALFHKAATLGQLERFAEAVEAYGQVVARFGDAPELERRDVVAAASFNKANTLRQMDLSREAVEVYGQVVDRFGDAPEPELRDLVARALFNKANTFAELGQPAEAVKVCDQLVDRFGDAPEPELRDLVAKALFNKANTFAELGKPAEAVKVCDEVVARIGDAPEPEMGRISANARSVRRSLITDGEEDS